MNCYILVTCFSFFPSHFCFVLTWSRAGKAKITFRQNLWCAYLFIVFHWHRVWWVFPFTLVCRCPWRLKSNLMSI